MGLGLSYWDGAVLRNYPGATILDTSFDESSQSRRYLVCRDGELFFLTLHLNTRSVRRESLGRAHEFNVTCVVQKKKRRR